MFRLDRSNLEFVEDEGILRGADYASLAEGEQILEAARQEAAALLEAARQEAASIREEASADGERLRQQGFEEGQQAGKEEIAERMVDCMTQSAAYFSRVEGVLVELVMRAARRVLGEFDQQELTERVVRRALETTRNEGSVKVRVMPGQADALKARLSSILEDFPKIEFLEVIPDSRISGNGCILETELGTVDASLETQLKAIEKAIVNAMQ